MKSLLVSIISFVCLSSVVRAMADEKDPDEFILSGKGSVAVVVYASNQDVAIETAVNSFVKTTLIDTKIIKAKGDFCCKKAAQLLRESSAEAAIFIIDDKDMPIGVVAMEERWAFVNVGALGKDGAAKDVLEKRIRCMIVRSAGTLIGVLVPRTTNGIMVGAAKLTDLDAIKTEYLTYDLLANIKRYSEKSGIVPGRRMSYRKACERGIAPQPTTEYQKKVWEEFHSMPTKPIKIKYDKKLGK